ncbi:hypothetical protein BN1723_018356, partial [Verticillium longisporum]
HPQQVQLPP